MVGETDFIQESHHVLQTHSCGAQERPGAVRNPDRKAQRGRPGKVSHSSCRPNGVKEEQMSDYFVLKLCHVLQ